MIKACLVFVEINMEIVNAGTQLKQQISHAIMGKVLQVQTRATDKQRKEITGKLFKSKSDPREILALW